MVQQLPKSLKAAGGRADGDDGKRGDNPTLISGGFFYGAGIRFEIPGSRDWLHGRCSFFRPEPTTMRRTIPL